jgi:hypothetical protein
MKTYTITIDDEPLAPKKSASGNRYIHPVTWLIAKLKVGQSFLYPASTHEKHNTLRSLASGYAKRNGIKIATRTITDRDGVDRLRFYRTA